MSSKATHQQHQQSFPTPSVSTSHFSSHVSSSHSSQYPQSHPANASSNTTTATTALASGYQSHSRASSTAGSSGSGYSSYAENTGNTSNTLSRSEVQYSPYPSRPSAATVDTSSLPAPGSSGNMPTNVSISAPSGLSSVGAMGTSGYLSELLKQREAIDAAIKAAEQAAASGNQSYISSSADNSFPAGMPSHSSRSFATHSQQQVAFSSASFGGDYPVNGSSFHGESRSWGATPSLTSLLNDDTSSKPTFTNSWEETPRAMYEATSAVYSNDGSGGGLGYNDYPDYAVDDNAPMCECGIPCIRLTSRTSANMNREFYKCANSSNPSGGGDSNATGATACRFFEWVDGDAGSSSTGGLNVSDGSNVIRDYKNENRHVFGHRAFRAGQKECIEAALAGIFNYYSCYFRIT